MKDTKALVSIIVPVYNVEKYLDRCIQSIVDQTYTNLEIILVDDGSPDNCPQMCDAWADRDDRIKVIHKQNEGMGMARNSGMEIAAGEYWMFVDSDDYISKNAVEVLLDRIIEDGSDMAVGKFINIYDDGSIDDFACGWFQDAIMTREDVLQRMGEERDLPASIWGKLYSIKVLEKKQFATIKYSEDLLMFLLVVDDCCTVSIVNEIVYCYYQRSNSMVHQRTEESRRDAVHANLYAARFLYERGFEKSARRRYYFAICEGLWLKDKNIVKSMMAEWFTPEERRYMMKNATLDAWIRWICIYASVSVSFLHILKKIKRRFS